MKNLGLLLIILSWRREYGKEKNRKCKVYIKNTKELQKVITEDSGNYNEELADLIIKKCIFELTDQDLEKLIALKSRIEEKETANSILAYNYKKIIYWFLFGGILVSLTIGIVAGKTVYADNHLIGILFVTTLFVPFCIGIADYFKNNIIKLLCFLPSILPILVYGNNILKDGIIGRMAILSLICLMLIIFFLLVVGEVKHLSKSDAFNIMTLIFTFISMGISLFSLYITLHSV